VLQRVAVCFCIVLLLCECEACVLQYVVVRCCSVRATHVCCSVLQCIAAVSGQRMCVAVCCCIVSATHV